MLTCRGERRCSPVYAQEWSPTRACQSRVKTSLKKQPWTYSDLEEVWTWSLQKTSLTQKILRASPSNRAMTCFWFLLGSVSQTLGENIPLTLLLPRTLLLSITVPICTFWNSMLFSKVKRIFYFKGVLIYLFATRKSSKCVDVKVDGHDICPISILSCMFCWRGGLYLPPGMALPVGSMCCRWRPVTLSRYHPVVLMIPQLSLSVDCKFFECRDCVLLSCQHSILNITGA